VHIFTIVNATTEGNTKGRAARRPGTYHDLFEGILTNRELCGESVQENIYKRGARVNEPSIGNTVGYG